MLVGSAVFAIIAVTVFQTYSTFINLVALGKYKIMAADIIDEQFELVRNLKYSDVGIKNSSRLFANLLHVFYLRIRFTWAHQYLLKCEELSVNLFKQSNDMSDLQVL